MVESKRAKYFSAQYQGTPVPTCGGWSQSQPQCADMSEELWDTESLAHNKRLYWEHIVLVAIKENDGSFLLLYAVYLFTMHREGGDLPKPSTYPYFGSVCGVFGSLQLSLRRRS